MINGNPTPYHASPEPEPEPESGKMAQAMAMPTIRKNPSTECGPDALQRKLSERETAVTQSKQGNSKSKIKLLRRKARVERAQATIQSSKQQPTKKSDPGKEPSQITGQPSLSENPPCHLIPLGMANINREYATEIAKKTMDILNEPRLFPRDLSTTDLERLIKNCSKNTELYTPDDIKKLYKIQDNILQKSPPETTKIEVAFETSIHACQRVKASIGDEELMCLNFASAKKPGGGFLNGAIAQEESLARSSALFMSLNSRHATPMYSHNKHYSEKYGGLYSHTMIYSPDVPVFKNDKGDCVPPYTISFITSPAVNISMKEISVVSGNSGKSEKNRRTKTIPRSFTDDEVNKTRNDRAEYILLIAAIHNVKHLILGAWGCGVFQNPPDEVAECFSRLLLGKFSGVFKSVTFAITDHGQYKIFKKKLETSTPPHPVPRTEYDAGSLMRNSSQATGGSTPKKS